MYRDGDGGVWPWEDQCCRCVQYTRSWGLNKQCCKKRPGIACQCGVLDQRVMQIYNDGHFTVNFHPV